MEVTEAPYTDKELEGILQQWISNTTDYEYTHLIEARANAWKMYLAEEGQSILASKEGFSSAIATDLADVTEAVLAQIMPAFSAGDVVEFTPMAMGDEDQADAETMACNTMFLQHNTGWQSMYQALKSALLFRNGIIKVYVEETDEGQQLRIYPVETGRFMIDPNWDQQNIQDVTFVGERKGQLTRSDLIGMGIPAEKLEGLGNSTDADNWQEDLMAKQVGGFTDSSHNPTRDADRIEIIDVYLKIDLSGDGEATQMRYLVGVSGDSVQKILLEEQTEIIPYATGTAFMVPNRWSGLSLYDKLKELVLNKSHTLRQWIDNSAIVNNSRYAATEGMVNMDDLLNMRPGGVVRTKDPMAVTPIPGIDQGQSLGALLS